MTEQMTDKLIHIAKVYTEQGMQYLWLKQIEPRKFQWFWDRENAQTEVFSDTIEEAIRLAARKWKMDDFACLNCGFRYTLPERDEHGINALFYQMAASQDVSNGIYFDEELGNNCFVQNIPTETRDLLKALKARGVC